MHTPQRSLGVLRDFARDLFLARIYFLDKPLWALRHAHPCAALAFSAPLREPHFSRDIFFAKPQRALRHALPCAALAFSAPLREAFFPRDVFSRQAVKGAKACTSLRSLGLLRDFARDVFSRGIFFLAKPQRALRHAHPSAQPWRSPRLHALILQPL